MHWAAARGHKEVAELLIAEGADDIPKFLARDAEVIDLNPIGFQLVERNPVYIHFGKAEPRPQGPRLPSVEMRFWRNYLYFSR